MTDSPAATVLVVDDEEDLADVYTQYLATEYDVRTATSGGEALAKVDETVDVVLLDRRMPDITGDEVLRELRGRGLDCRVAMLTSVEPTGEIVDMPFDEYRVKPADRGELHSLVEELLRRATHDALVQEFYSLASKKSALEVEGNTDTDEYQRLLERIEAVRAEIDTSLDGDDAAGLFNDLPEGESSG